MDSMSYPRRNHSIAVMLADATVLSAGGDDAEELTAEIFSPAYLFTGQTRPVIGFAPKNVQYGTQFRVIMSDPGVQPIGKVSLVRPGAVTHRFDQDQRFVELNIVQQVGSTLTLDAPDDANRAPPGYYMLFLISDAAVPSVASYVLLE